jgi:cytochrome c556
LSTIPRARAALERFLPAWPFKQMGMSVHRDFDAIADGIEQGETGPQTLQRLSNIMSRCTTCHDMYRLSAK